MSQKLGKCRTLVGPALVQIISGIEQGSKKSQTSQAAALEKRARKRARAERKFYNRLFFYLAIVAVAFILDGLSGPGWWFYWLAIGLGVIIASQAFRLFSPANRFDDEWEERKARTLLASAQGKGAKTASRRSPAGRAANGMSDLILRGESELASMRVNSVRIEKPQVQAQALRICERADQILTVLAEPARDEELGREFVDRVLPTAQTVFSSYVRLSERQIARAQPALVRVETSDLPLIERTLNDLFEQLHRYDVISLEVASEMLTLGKPGYIETR
jgi:hypothetical protein